MTQMNSHRPNCPECAHLQETVVWGSLNVSLDPDLREKLFNGEINEFNCQACGKRALINVALLYHDMERQYCVQYYPAQAMEDPEFLKAFARDGTLNFDGLLNVGRKIGKYFMEPHIVFDLSEMIQYIKFRDKLYDLHGKMKS